MKWDISNIKEWSWKKHPPGAVILEPGNAAAYRTGNWRVERPVLDREKCSNCYLCFIYCPESSVMVEEEVVTGFDLEHCKGCKICAEVCPRGAISLVGEAEITKAEASKGQS